VNFFDRMKNMTSRERYLLIATVLVLTGGAVYIYVGEPLFLKWSDLHDESKTLQMRLAKLKILSKDKDVIEQGFEDIQSAIPSGESTESLQIDFFKEIHDFATSAEIDVTSLKQLKIDRKGRFDSLVVRMNCVGENHQLAALLQHFQERENLIQCSDISLSANRRPPTLSITLTLSKLVLHREGHR